MKCPMCHGDRSVDGVNPCPICGGSGKDPFSGAIQIYEVGPLALLASGVNSITQQISNYDFNIVFLMAVATSTLATALITDKTTGYQFSNQQVHLQNMFGTSQNPFYLPQPYLLKKGAIIQIDATDLSAAPNSIRFAFAGLQDLGR